MKGKRQKSEKRARKEARRQIAESVLYGGEVYSDRYLYLFGESSTQFTYCYTGETRDHYVNISK